MNIEIGQLIIHYENPLANILLFVLLMVVTVVVYFYMVRLRERRATAFGNIHTLERVQGFRRYSPSHTVLIMKLILICLLFLAATQSVEFREKRPVTNTDYMLLIDTSGSMAQSDFSPTRLAAAKELSDNWLEEVPNSTRVGVVAFSSTVESYVPLTTDKSLLKVSVDSIEPIYGHAGTSVDYALNFAVDALNSSDRNKTILLFTDGTDPVSPVVVSRVVQANIPVIAFGIGSMVAQDTNRTIPVNASEYFSEMTLNFTILSDLANSTHGAAYRVSTVKELQRSFSEATLRETQQSLNTNYYFILIIAIFSIAELLVYSREGAL